MSRQDVWKQFIEAVYTKGQQENRPVTAWEIGQELFGSDEQVVRQSTINIADECKAAGLLTVPIDYQEVYVTPEGMRFIGKSQGDA